MKRLAAALAATSLVLLSSPAVQADPAAPTPALLSAFADRFCGMISQNPHPDGVMAALDGSALDEFTDVTGGYAILHAVIYTCPQHQQLVLDVMSSLMPEGCAHTVAGTGPAALPGSARRHPVIAL